jgi:hypothetical protein
MVSANGANLLGEYINTIKENSEALLQAGKEVSLEANVVKTQVYVHVESPERMTKP